MKGTRTIPVLCRLITLPVTAMQFVLAQPFEHVPRSVSLANANVAEVGSIENMYGNPASLAFSMRSTVSLSYVQGKGDHPALQNACVPLLSGTKFALAMGVAASSVGYVSGSGHEKMFSYGCDIASGYEIVPRLSVGGLVSMRWGAGNGASVSAVSSSFGFLYSPSPEISYAIAFLGAGTGIGTRPSGDSLVVYQRGLERRLHVGASMRYPSSASLRRPILSISLSNEKTFDVDGLVYRGGIEVFPIGELALRVGYTVGPDISAPSYGTGLLMGRVRIDYAFARRDQDERTHQVSVSLDL